MELPAVFVEYDWRLHSFNRRLQEIPLIDHQL